jgi:copper chaperone
MTNSGLFPVRHGVSYIKHKPEGVRIMKNQILLVPCITMIALVVGGCATTGGEARTSADDAEVITATGATLVVHGMSCPLCANNVDKQLLDVPGVSDVLVDMGTGEVKVSFAPDATVTRGQLVRAVDRSGFTLAEVRVP